MHVTISPASCLYCKSWLAGAAAFQSSVENTHTHTHSFAELSKQHHLCVTCASLVRHLFVGAGCGGAWLAAGEPVVPWAHQHSGSVGHCCRNCLRHGCPPPGRRHPRRPQRLQHHAEQVGMHNPTTHVLNPARHVQQVGMRNRTTHMDIMLGRWMGKLMLLLRLRLLVVVCVLL